LGGAAFSLPAPKARMRIGQTKVRPTKEATMIVMKFGGTSVESAAAIERVAGIVKAREERRPVVVVSAMGKTTNKLLALANAAIGSRARAPSTYANCTTCATCIRAKLAWWCRSPSARPWTGSWMSTFRN
jgi:hypothetical protein